MITALNSIYIFIILLCGIIFTFVIISERRRKQQRMSEAKK
jgi:preprotein translocase subunit YajC